MQGQGRGEECRGAQKQSGGRHWAPLEPMLLPHRILRLMLLHIKYLYGIRVEVRGAHHFPPSQPYVVVSNHQSSLDLLGETPHRTHLPQPFPSFWNLLQDILPWRSSTLPHLGPCHLSWGWSSPHMQGGRPLVTLPFTLGFPPLFQALVVWALTWVGWVPSWDTVPPP